MDYKTAFIKLYGAAGEALDELCEAKIISQEIVNVIQVLKKAVREVEDMDE